MPDARTIAQLPLAGALTDTDLQELQVGTGVGSSQRVPLSTLKNYIAPPGSGVPGFMLQAQGIT